MLDIHIDPEVSLLRIGNSSIALGASVQDVLAALKNNVGKAAVEKSQVSVVDIFTKGVRLKTRGDNYKFQFTFHPALHRLQVATVENTKDVRLFYKGTSIGYMEGEILKSSHVLDFLTLECDTENDVYFAREKDVWFIFEVKEVEIPQEHVDLDVSRAENKEEIIQQVSKGLNEQMCEDCNASISLQNSENTKNSSSKGESNTTVGLSTRVQQRPEFCSTLEKPENVAREHWQQTTPQDVMMSEDREESLRTSSIDTAQVKFDDCSSSTGGCDSAYSRDLESQTTTSRLPTAKQLPELDCILKIPEKVDNEQNRKIPIHENDTSLPSLASPEDDELHGQSGPLSNISNMSEFEILQNSLNSACEVTNDSDFSILDYDCEANLSKDTVGVIDTPTSPEEDMATPLQESITPPVTERIQRPTKKVHVLRKVILFSERIPAHSTSVVSRRTDAIECVNVSFGQQTDERGAPTGVVSRGISIGKNRDLIPGCPKIKANIFWFHSGLPAACKWFLDVLGDPDELHEYKHGSNHMLLAYYRHGLDLVVQLHGKTMRVRRVILHTAYPGHPDFSLYNRCFFRIQVPYELSQKTNIQFLTTFSSLEDVEKVTEVVKSPHTAGKLCRMYSGHNYFIKMTSMCQIATVTVDPCVGNLNDMKEVITNTALSFPSWQPSANSVGLPNILEQVPENEELTSMTDSKIAEDWKKNYGNKFFFLLFLSSFILFLFFSMAVYGRTVWYLDKHRN